MAHQSLIQEYLQMPVVTRAYITACAATTVAEHLDLVSPFQLYFNPTLIMKHYHFWRLITTFLHIGTFGFNFLFNMVFLYRYCKMLEEGFYRNRTADFVVMFIFGAVCMICCAFFTNLLFLGPAFTTMLVYVWARRNPDLKMNFFGLLTFPAPFLPWVLLILSLLMGNTVIVELLGIGVGHSYYFLEDIFPLQQGGFRILKSPTFLKTLLDGRPEDSDYNPLPEERPGGFNWGEADAAEPRDHD